MPDAAQTNLASIPLNIRVPAELERQLQSLARRDANSVSAVVRRLLMAGLRVERENERRG